MTLPFWIEDENGCWIWQRSTDGPGYAKANGAQRMFSVHRLAWCLANGEPEVPEGMDVGHSCDVRMCIRPMHLLLQTRSENIQQMYDHERDAPGQRDPGRTPQARKGGP